MLPRLGSGLLVLLALSALSACDPAGPGPDDPGGSVAFEVAFPPILEGTGNIFDARDPNPVLAAFGDVLLTPGYVSFDAGLTWEELPAPLGNPVLFNGGPRGVATGTIGPVRFDLVARTVTPIPGPPDAQFVFPAALRSRDGALFATGLPEAAYRLRNDTWTRLTLPDVGGQPSVPQSIAVDEDATVYVLLRAAGSPWVDWLAVSENDGATWTLRSVPRQNGGAVRVLPSGTVLSLGADRGMLRSTDQGRTWQDIRPPTGTGAIPDVQITADGQALYRGFLAPDGASPWTRAIDLGALGMENRSDDKIVANQSGGYLIANRVHGVFVTAGSGAPLDYAGGFTSANQTTGEISTSQSMVPLPDGSAVAASARYDPARGRWVWTDNSNGRVTRLGDGRLASHSGCRVRISSDGGRTWGAPATRPPPSDQLTCETSFGVLSLSDGRIVASERWTFQSQSFENRLYTSTDQGRSFTQTGRLIAYAAGGTTLYGFRERFPDGGRGAPEPWGERFALASMPGGGVLFATNTQTRVVKRWDDGRETTFGPVTGIQNRYEGEWIAGVDENAYAYVACGTPLRQFCRSTRPLR